MTKLGLHPKEYQGMQTYIKRRGSHFSSRSPYFSLDQSYTPFKYLGRRRIRNMDRWILSENICEFSEKRSWSHPRRKSSSRYYRVALSAAGDILLKYVVDELEKCVPGVKSKRLQKMAYPALLSIK
jgi:hypothetical protein